jgi:predicted Zn finger-like uncharacterized protein
MKFVCDRCQTRYSIADEKIRQKILRIRCKTCGNVILVQESSAIAEESAGAPAPHSAVSSGPKAAPGPAAKVSSGLKTPPVPAKAASGPKAPPLSTGKVASGPKSPPPPPSKSPSGLKAPTTHAAKASSTESQTARAAIPPPPPAASAVDPLGGRVEWFVAVGGAQSGPFSRAEAAKRILAIDPDKAVHVWKQGMAGWKSPNEVSVIAQEVNLLRPAPPPPPGGESAKASLTPRPSVTPPPLAHPAPRAGRTGEVPKSAVALHAPPAKEVADFQADVDTSADAFLEQTTQKNKRPVEALARTFSDTTTKKGKNLRGLEADPLLASSVQHMDEEKTPTPVRPLTPVVARRTGAMSIQAGLAEPPTVPNPPSFLPPGLESGPSVVFETGRAPMHSPSAPVEGFSEVVAAMSTVPSSSPAAAVPAMEYVPLITAPTVVPPTDVVTRSRAAELFQGRSGLKYLMAAVVLIGLVILLVVFSLRGDGSKPHEAPKPPEPVAVVPEQPTATEEPSAGPAPDEHTASNRPATRHGTPAPLKTKSVGPVERPVAAPKTSGKPARDDSARPNPFSDGVKAVSQDQISAVVRNKNNQAALKSCYERALKMDNRLTSGRMDVTVSISASGAVQRVVVNAPSSFIMIEPCIKLAVRRWTFPPSSEEYATNFPLIMQGGM